MQRYEVAITRDHEAETVCWEGQARSGEDALRAALAAGALAGGWAVIARVVPSPERQGQARDL